MSDSPRLEELDELERRIAWILGSPRSGSTWLSRLLAAQPGATLIGEPLIGMHLAPFAPGLLHREPLIYPLIQSDRPDYFFNDRYREVWGPATRELILRRLGAEAGADGLAIVKEPHGSQGAETIGSLLPRSFLIFLLRDGRDVVDSEVAALEPGSWLGAAFDVRVPRTQLVEHSARTWLIRTEIVERAFAAHDPGRRHLVRYEELLADTAGELTAIAAALGIPADPARIETTVGELAFARIADTGPTRFNRRARPGGWRESLTAEEQRLLAEILDPKLSELGYET